MKKYCFLFLLGVVASCQPQTKPVKTASVDWPGAADSAAHIREHLQELERKATVKKNDTLGRLVGTIDFNVMSYDSVLKKEEVISMIELDSPEMKHLMHRDELVLKDTKVTLIIDYPLKNADMSELVSANGFTRQALVAAISRRYHEVYEEEESSATIKTIPAAQRTTMYNRNETNGKYGIWGHDISDLVLTSIWVYQNDRGQVFLSLQIDS